MSNICPKCNIRMNIYEEDVTDDYDRYNAMMNGRNVLDHYDYCWSCPECHEKLDVNMKELATYKQLYKIKKDLGINFECGYNHFPSLTKHEAWLLIKYLNKIEDKDKSVWDYMNNKFKNIDNEYKIWFKMNYKHVILLNLLKDIVSKDLSLCEEDRNVLYYIIDNHNILHN